MGQNCGSKCNCKNKDEELDVVTENVHKQFKYQKHIAEYPPPPEPLISSKKGNSNRMTSEREDSNERKDKEKTNAPPDV